MEPDTTVVKVKDGLELSMRLGGCPDAPAIVSIVKSSSEDRSYVLMEHYGAGAESIKRVVCDLDSDKNLLLVAEVGSTVIGVLSALQYENGSRPETAHVLQLGVHLLPAYRGKGIGTAMVLYAEQWARKQGFRKIEVDIFTTDSRSIGVFTAQGYQVEGSRRQRIRVGKKYIDEILLGKVLE